MTCKGTVRGNVVVLEDEIVLPEGTPVEVRIVREARSDEDPFAALLARRAAYAERYVQMEEILEEDKQEREEHPDTWLSTRR